MFKAFTPKDIGVRHPGALVAVVAAGMCFAAGDMAAKTLSATVPATQIAWMRYLVFAVISVPAAYALHGRDGLATARPWFQAGRAAAITGSTLLFILGLGRLGLAEATAINFTSPIMVMAIAPLALGEKAAGSRWMSAAIAFAGVLVIAKPGGGAFSPAALFPAAAALCWAISSILTRAMASERTETTMAWSSVAGCAALAVTLPFAWHSLNLAEALLALAVGIFSTGGNWLVIVALRLAPASYLAPFFYLQIISAGAMAWMLTGVPPSPSTFLGGTLIALAGILAARRKPDGQSRQRPG